MGRLKRTGWMLSKIPHDLAEDVAEHSLKVSYLTLHISNLLASRSTELNVGKALKMALIHDLPEAVVSDIPKTLRREIKWEEMNEVELKALSAILKDFKGKEELITLFREYSTGESIEAKAVSLADNLATYLQCMSYIEDHGIRTTHLADIESESLETTLRLIEELGLSREELFI